LGFSLSSSPLLHLLHNTQNLRVSSNATATTGMHANYYGAQVSDMVLSLANRSCKHKPVTDPFPQPG
jgi:hypothetical protein